MIWLRAWYDETNSFTQYPGPRCRDGGMLREARLSRSDCQQTDSRSNQIPLTNEHGDIFSRQIDMNINNDCEDITDNIDELPTQSSINRPYPTESEYIYDQYVDYSTNDTNSIIQNNTSSSPSIVGNIVENPAINISNTVLNYNKFKQQQQQQQFQQRGSQFTFFGVPLPSLNMGNLWNNNNGRSANTRSAMGTKGKARVQVYKPEDMEIYKFLNRNDQQETTISRNGNSQTNFDDNEQNRSYYRPYFKTPFSEPQMENGGFTPMLPGSSGGFRPIHNPHANASEQLQSEHSSNIQRIQKNGSLSEPEVYHELVPLVTDIPYKNRIVSIQELETSVTSEQPTELNALAEQQPEPDLSSYVEWEDAAAIPSTISPLQNFLADISTASSSSIGDVYDEYSETTAMSPVVIDAETSVLEHSDLQLATSNTTEKFILTTAKPQTTNTQDPWLNININSPSSLSELVAPGAQLPSESSGYRSSPAGRSTITKIFSTPIPVAEEYQRTTSVMKNTNQNNRIYDDDSWTVIEESTTSTTMKPLFNKKPDMDWYYANYNQSTIVDTFDPSLNSLRSAASNQCTITRIPNTISISSLFSLNILFILLRSF